ncbi:MAG: cytochrome c biogenesis protein CcdA [Actinomycetia bacterium]|nr:cytochrome c biogenesis protein CcdA [Actinomycetes bacterium]MCP4959961.1 cytochrome c biogenesis protein CcdA [Actinomycetes bacterium]
MSDFETVTFFSYLVAFSAGVISFLSPCVLPIVPGYISIITGLSAGELQEGGHKHTIAISRDTGMFVGGFTAVFVLLGLSASSIGNFFFDNQETLTRLSGGLMFLMAMFMVGSIFLKAPWLYQEARFHPQLGRFGRGAPAVAGAAFGFGWTPCIGPVLASILGVAASSGRATQGATLLFVYSMGLGLPFLITGLAFGKLTGAFAWVKRHFTVIVVGSAVLLAVFGVVLMFDRLPRLTAELSRFMEAIGLGRLVELG